MIRTPTLFGTARKLVGNVLPQKQSLRDAALMDVLGFSGLAKQLLSDAARNGGPAELRNGFRSD